ncbi:MULTISPECIES: ABC transporter ATP-binding protein [Oligella]|uniref:Beta-(1-->2)glucan export ATP-binding/permease protein NdvA n=3 Tax=Oligella urethralis TaxID=90245 RepID=A0A2N6Q9G2_9BURK|nr:MULTISPECIES: ABC transporter ATP-binding protein [Oligella]AVL70582.1 ABC transporter ATP-binding protein [Oligella urethralis]OFV48248.1 hypothetical protein HMPREF3179_06600 [Oligella sp. HMSC09E12]PMC15378.1 ABC transporter ATP-binding protein [Oligella urethralis]WOS36828.1 Vitamin B12 import ATP-binding protein BtuD [Oligella urethralis]SPY08103.1 Beta-(1-->2)glucan export ATP-binding/permease protein NdvA [Oligella urethralis]
MKNPIIFITHESKHRLIKICLGWLLVAVAECIAYAYLSLAIIGKSSTFTIFVSSFIAIIITTTVTRSGFLTGIALAGDLFRFLGHSLSKTKPAWFSSDNRVLTLIVASENIPQLMSIPAHQLQGLIHTPLIPLGMILTIGLVIDIKLGFAVFIIAIVACLGLTISQLHLKKVDQDRHANNLKQHQAYNETIEKIDLFKSFKGVDSLSNFLTPHWNTELKEKDSLNKSATAAIILSQLCKFLPILLSVYIGALYSFSAAYLLVLAILSNRLTATLEDTSSTIINWHDFRATLTNYKKVINAPKLEQSNNNNTIKLKPNIEVSISLHGPTLRDIKLTIPYGERVWIKGQSGAGKSTLIDLLMRFDDPGIGHIKIDNHSLRDISTTSIAKLIAYVPQEPIIFTGSLLSNLTYGLVNVDNKAVHEVIEALDLTQLIERDSLGLEQSVGQQGSALSGGEAQRICLARAILKNTPILLLDEPTSAVDTTTEKKIIDYLINRECTIIYVTHNNGELWRPTQTVTLDKPKNEIKTSKQIN